MPSVITNFPIAGCNFPLFLGKDYSYPSTFPWVASMSHKFKLLKERPEHNMYDTSLSLAITLLKKLTV